MSTIIVTRSPADRIRHTVLFELLLIALLTPVISLLLDRPLMEIGILAVVLSLKAMLINPLFNYCFDRWDVKRGRIPTQRGLWLRICHAIGLEAVLTATSLPFYLFWLGLTLPQALLMDVGILFVVMFYTLIFNWLYDQIFPVIQPEIISSAV